MLKDRSYFTIFHELVSLSYVLPYLLSFLIFKEFFNKQYISFIYNDYKQLIPLLVFVPAIPVQTGMMQDYRNELDTHQGRRSEKFRGMNVTGITENFGRNKNTIGILVSRSLQGGQGCGRTGWQRHYDHSR